MGTMLADMITGYMMVEINDVRLSDELNTNPAAFFRRMTLYAQNAIPRFNRPPEIRQWLTYTPPSYNDFQYVAQSNENAPITIATGLDGFSLCSVGLTGTDVYGNPYYTPVTDFTYDDATGNVVLNIDLQKDQAVEIDLYTDGEFTNTLTPEMLRILGLCGQYVWENRFVGDWLLQTPKIKDKSFDTGSEANQSRANSERLRLLRDSLNAEILAFEQGLVYNNTIPVGMRYTFPTV